MSELPEDVAKAGQNIVARLQQEPYEEISKHLVESFGSYINPDFLKAAEDFNEAVNKKMSPELRAMSNALDADLAALLKSGEKATDHPDIQKRMQELLENPEYTKIIDDMMRGDAPRNPEPYCP